MSVDILERMRATFRSEALDLLAELDTALLTMESGPGDGDLVHRVFRAIHTVKGSGATAGLTHLAAFAHKAEEAFDMARSGRLAISAELVDCGLRASDILRAILSAADPDAECPGEKAVIEALSRLMPQAAPGGKPSGGPAAAENAKALRAAYEVMVRPHRELFFSGTDPVTLLDELRALGQAHITVHAEEVPLFLDLDAESSYLWWEVMLVTERGEAAIRAVFGFVEDECDVTIRLLDDQSSSVALLGSIPAETLELFAIECQEHLDTMESQALVLETDNALRESLDALFRAVHSIKGNAGLLLGQVPSSSLTSGHPLPVLARMAHAIESALDPHRQQDGNPVPPETVALVLETRDAMQALLTSLSGQASGTGPAAELLKRLGLEVVTQSTPAATAGDSAFRNTAIQCLDLFEGCLHQLQNGETGPSILKAYRRGLKTLASAAVYQKRTDLDEPVAAQLRILDVSMQAGAPLNADDLAQLQDFFQDARAKVESPPPPMEEVPSAAGPATGKAAVAATASTSSGTVRIDQEKLDRLMRVVGELLVARGAIPTLAEKLAGGDDPTVIARALKDAGAGISRIAEELQASVMAIRMLPVKTVLQRFPRLVRDLARSLGKDVELVIEGDSVELDKTILEQIGDPLVHLVRNGVDHGLESPEERRSQGKNPAGRLVLRASNEAGNVVIEIEDDGRGLDADKLRRKAVEKGLVTAEAAAAMTSSEACQLVFLPGLSTAEKVTDVSGRGVGMDVVRNNIRSLQGTVEIRSKPGSGTVFTIKLPTSLIISKGILLEAGGQEYILPLSAIRDMVKVPAAAVHDYQGSRITQVRGEVYSIFSLAEIFGLPFQPMAELSVAVVDAGTVRYGLLADRFVSEVEVLVKPLSGGLEHCREFHGAAIMGDGRVVLVLNPQECHAMYRQEMHQADSR